MMAGRNQHYIPRFLQRAFGIRPARKQIWHFGRGEAAEERPIKRTAAKNDFYSGQLSDEQAKLDDAITEVESHIAESLNECRARHPGDGVGPATAAAIVSHLAQRTDHVRATTCQVAEHVLQRMKETFSEPNNFEALVGLSGTVPDDRFRELVMSELTVHPKIAEFGIPYRVLERFSFLFVKENAGELARQGGELANAMVGILQPQTRNLARESHNKALGGMIASSEYQSFLKTFDWRIESGPAAGAILPDCVVIGIGSDGIAGNHLLVGGKEMRVIMLAISPEKVLVGRKAGFALPSNFNFNIEAARLSRSFFLAPRNDEETARLHTMIGQKLRPALEEAVDLGLKDVVARKSGEVLGSRSPDDDTLILKPTSRIQYQLSLSGCDDELKTAAIQAKVACLVTELAGVMRLDRLDGITIGNDYPGLLRAVERGWENAPAPETVPPEIGVGVAQTVMVSRSGLVKGRIVASSAVSDALVSDDTEQCAWARYVLARQLAEVAHMEIVENCLPGTLLEPIDTGIDGWLYMIVNGVPESYSASCMAAPFGNSDNIESGLRELLVSAIDRMMIVVPRERLAYRNHGDLDRLLAVVLPAVRHLLLVSANLLGHCAYADKPLHGKTNALRDALDRAGLSGWLRVFRYDLERFRLRSGRWESFEEFLDLNIHAERLLFSVGMFAWDSPEGLRVEVPLGTDAKALLARLPRE